VAHDIIADPGSILPRSGAVGNYAAVTAAPVTETIPGNGAESVELIINVSVLTATQTLTVTISGVDVFGNSYVLLASAAIAATGITRLRVTPWLASSANAIAQDLLPEKFTVSYVLNNGLSLSFTVSATLFP